MTLAPGTSLLQKAALLLAIILLNACPQLKPMKGKTPLATRLRDFPAHDLPLRQDVIVHWDEHMIPFVEAGNDLDLAFALGLVHAHLRLAQMELMRRISQGRLSEIAGPLNARFDKSLRILDLGHAKAQIKENMEERPFLEAFLQGVNFFQTYAPLPPEMRLWRIKAEPWSIEDLITLSRLLAIDVNWFLWFGQIGLLCEPEWSNFWARVKQVQSRSLPSIQGEAAQSALLLNAHKAGSNCFAISGRLSASGAPVLASDPHLGLQLPNFWLIVGVKSPSYHTLGLMFPGVPLVLIGRNEKIAWGATNMRALSSNLYKIKPAEEAKLLSNKETIKVRWWFDKTIIKRTHRHGPVISDAPALRNYAGEPLALKWIGHEASDEISALLRMNRAKDWPQFRQAFENYAISGQNYLYADAAGNIGQIMAVKLPKQLAKYEDSFVLDSEAAWEGYLGTNELPYAFNPQQGYLISANNAPAAGELLPDDVPQAGLYFSANDRFTRLSQLIQAQLRSGRLLDLPYIQSMQLDVCSPAALEVRDLFVAGIQALPDQGGLPGRKIAALLKSWDGCFRKESKAALVFELLEFYFVRSFYSKLWGKKIAGYLLGSDMAAEFLKDDLAEALNPQAAANQAAVESLCTALKETNRTGQGFKSWGDIHRLRLKHPLGYVPLLGWFYQFGDYPADGGSTTIWKTAHSLSDRKHYAYYGANARCIMDLSDLDANYFVLLGGQDGFLGSAHFLDQVPLWFSGRYVKVPLKMSTIRKEFKFKTVLKAKR